MRKFLVCTLTALSGLGNVPLWADVMSTLTYQGSLSQNGIPSEGEASLRFALFDAETDGNLVAGPVELTDVHVARGLFTVELDFGPPAFNGAARWIEISVSRTAGGPFNTLSPRQAVTATPYSMHTRGLNVDAAGRLGIGTGTPQAALDVNGDAIFRGFVLDFRGADFRMARPSRGDGGRVIVHEGDGTTERMVLNFGNDFNDGVRIDGKTVLNGYVGIGTASPAAKLHVAGSMKVDGANTLEFGAGVPGKEANAGKIGYQTFTSDALDIVGAGTGELHRKVKLWAEAGTQFTGPIIFPDGTQQATAATAGSPSWALTGNAGANPDTHFIGTTDNQPLQLKINNHRSMKYSYGENTAAAGSEYRTVNVIGGSEVNSANPNVIGATIAGGGADYFTLSDLPNTVLADFGTIGGGYSNRAGTLATVSGGFGNFAAFYSFVGGGNLNSATGQFATVAGGSSSLADGYASTIAGGTFHNAPGQWSTVGGGETNDAGGAYATVAGGTANSANGSFATTGGGASNHASGVKSTASGGAQNTAAGEGSVVSGGFLNQAGYAGTISGGQQNTAGSRGTVGGGALNHASADSSTIGGGGNNNAGGNTATIAGGGSNTANGSFASVGGGWYNSADGDRATVPGGWENVASGNFSFAAGVRAKAIHIGSFVWNNFGQAADFASTGNNQFLINAEGGVGINTNAPAGFALNVAGAIACTALTQTSDARFKTNITSIAEPLQTIDKMRGVTFEWNAETSKRFPEGKQIGFIAQEIEAVLPELVTTDANGVKSVAYSSVVPVLVEAVKSQQQQISQLTAQNAELAERLNRIEARVNQ